MILRRKVWAWEKNQDAVQVPLNAKGGDVFMTVLGKSHCVATAAGTPPA